MELVFLCFTALLASTVASPILSPDSTATADSGSPSARSPWVPRGPSDIIGPDLGPPNEGFVPDEQEEACLKICPAVIPRLHPYKQPRTFLCRLRCGVDAYRRGRQGIEESPEQKGRGEGYLADEGHELVTTQELDALSLKKYGFWNGSDIEGQSEKYLAAEAAPNAGEENDRVIPELPMGNPCAWPPQWDDSWPSQRELYLCLESCPAGPFYGVCLHPCFLEITERRCKEKRVTEANAKATKYLTAEAALDVVEENSEPPQSSNACSERPQYNDLIYLPCEVGCAFMRPPNPLCKKGCIANAIMRCRVRKDAETQAPRFK
ncbi:ec61 protein [Colletotrichum incanum]|uniref:Ec61 protein n=1 Tax=Colletotrichum incanum TaxID=1573173 RepID=A0A161VW51_COLIC|nr:ec61 protein [Colletotrichum incanum]